MNELTIPTDDEVRSILGNISTLDPTARQKERDRLRLWKQDRDQKEALAKEDHFKRVYTDEGYFQEISKDPLITDAASVNPSPQSVAYGSANRAFLSHKLGRDLSGEEYEVQRDGYAKANFSTLGPVTDESFFTSVKGQYETEIKRESATRQLRLSAVSQALKDSLEGKQTSMAPAFQAWAEANRELINDKDESKYLVESFKEYRRTQANLEKFREPAGRVWRSLTNLTEGKGNDDDIMASANELAAMSLNDRKAIYGIAGMAAEANGIDRGAFAQVAKNLGESISRSFDFIPKGSLAAQEDAAILWRNTFKSGDFSLREDEDGNLVPVAGSFNAALGKQGYRAPTEEEKASYLAKAEQAIPIFQIIRELRSTAQTQIDPLRPEFDGVAGVFERGAYGAGGSVGLMGATALNPLVGVMAYRDETFDRLMLENPDMDRGAAKAIATTEGAANALVDKLQLEKFPALAGLFRNVRSNGWRGLRRIGGIWATQSGQELAQNAIEPVTETIAAALREDMADKNIGDEALQYLRDIPETLAATGWLALIGGGLISVRDVKNPMSDIDQVLSMNGFSKEQAGRIKSAKTPEEFDKAVREEFPKRSADDIALGIAESQDLAEQAAAAQSDPSKPTLETQTLPDGSQQYTVTDAVGNVELVTKNQDAAREAYVESSRLAAQEEILAKEEEQQSEESQLTAGRESAESEILTDTRPEPDPEAQEVKSETGIIAGSALEKWADEQIKEGRKRLNVGLDPVLLSAYSVKGAAIIERGIRDFAAWSAEMIANMGEAIRPNLKEIYDEANKTLAAKSVKVAKPKTPPRKVDREAEVAAALDRLKKDPEERLAVYGRMKAKFNKIAADNRIEIAAIKQSLPDPTSLPDIEPDLEAERQALESNIGKLEQNESASLDSLEAERAATIADIRSEETTDLERVGAEVVGQYAHQIENAKSTGRKASLTAQAKIRESERRKGIQKQYTEKIRRAEDGFRNQKKKLQDEAKKLRDKARDKSKDEEKRITDERDKQVREISASRTLGNIKIQREKLLRAMGELDALLSVLPAEVRGKVGGYVTLSKIGTGETALADFFVDRIAMIEKEMDRALTHEYSERINKVLERAQPKKGENRVKKSNIGPEAQEDVDFITSVIDLNESELAGKISEIQALMAAATEPEDLMKYSNQWGLANAFGNIDARKVEDLIAAWGTLSDIVKGGRQKWKIQEEQRLQEVANERKTALEELKAPRGVTDSEIQASKEKGETLASRVIDYFDSHLAWFQILGEVFGSNSKTASRFETNARKASNTYTDATIARKKQFRADMKKLLKAKNLPSLHTKIEALSRPEFTGAEFLEGRKVVVEKIPVERAIDAIGGKGDALGFDKSELADMVALIDEVQSNDYRKKYIQLERVKAAGKRVEQRMSQLDAVHYLLSWDQADVRGKMIRQGIDEKAINQLRKFLTPEANAVMDWLRDRYAEGYDRISPIYARLYGMKPPKIENYAPTFYDVKQADKSNMGGPTDTGAPNSGMSASFIKARTDHGKPMARINALEAYWRHSAQSEYWVAWSETVREMRGVLGHDEVMRAIRAKYGQAGERQIAGYMDAFENNGIKAAGMLSQISSLIHRQMSAGAVIALGYKVSTLMKQTSATLGSMLEIPAHEAVRSMGRLLQGKLSTSLSNVWKSDTIQRRVEGGFTPEVRAFMAREGYSPSLLLVAAEYGMAPIALTDAAFTTFSAAIAHDYHYRQAVKMGMDEAGAQLAAADKMDEVVKRTAQPAELADKSLIESHPGMKLFFMFLSEARQKAAISYLAAKQIMRGENVGMNIQRLAVGWVTMGLVTQLMTDLYKDVFTDEEDEDIWNLEDYGRAALMGHLNGLFLVGTVASGIITAATGGHVFPDTQNPMARISQNIQRKDFNPANWEDADGAMRGIQLYLDTIGRLAGSVALSAPAAMMNALKDVVGLGKNITTDD